MAKNLNFKIGEQVFSAAIAKVDRDKVYGYVEELVTDKTGEPCQTASLLDDGRTIVLAGATALKTVTADNQEVDKKALKTVYMDGRDAELVPSSYDADILLQKVDLGELFNMEVTTVYQLTWEDTVAKAAMLKALDAGGLYRFVFNYRADYEGADALVLGAQNEVFVLTGRMIEFEYLKNNAIIAPIEEEVAEAGDDLDFGML